MAEEEYDLHEEPRPREYRKVSVVEREREWLAKQFSKEREANCERHGAFDGAARGASRSTACVKRDVPGLMGEGLG
jgi:hypothetical protein